MDGREIGRVGRIKNKGKKIMENFDSKVEIAKKVMEVLKAEMPGMDSASVREILKIISIMVD